LSLAQKLGYIMYVCRALEYAHARGVIHRDIKPGNVMVSSGGNVKVVDFGIARLVDSGHTQSGLLIGTLGYMSPQQIRGKSAEVRSDIWAVGIVLYELLAHHRPFGGENQADLMMNILTQPTPPIADAVSSVPSDVVAVLDKMLQKDADLRFQSMQEVLIELEPICRRLQQDEVSRLVANGRQLFDEGDLGGAKDALGRALQYDTANTLAKSLLEKINAEVRRQQIVPQVKARVDKGQQLLITKQLEEAKAEAKAALDLDSTFQPARELLEQAQAALDRERALAQALRSAKQKLVEGDLAEAEAYLAKAFKLDPSNTAAKDLEKQIREEKRRRERQKRLSEIKHRSRSLWSELRYQECIDLLQQSLVEYPADLDLAKLLETTLQDKAEHDKQTLLTEARGLLGAQRFDEAIKLLESVLEESPSDPTATNLRRVAQQGREQQIQEQRFKEDLDGLRTLIRNAKYRDAIIRGESLLRQYPKDTEIEEMLSFARSEQAQQEQKLSRDRLLEKINRELNEEHYLDAIQTTEAALRDFPRDTEFRIALQKARQKQQQKERKELLERRIREVRTKIDRKELMEAINLARETIVHLGPNATISQLLNQAEVEYEQGEKRKQDRHEKLVAARTLVDKRDFSEATRVVDDALATQLFSRTDPEVTALLREIDNQTTFQPSVPPAPADPPSASASATWTKPSEDPAKDYVYQQAPTLHDVPSFPPADANASILGSPARVIRPSVPPAPLPTAIPETTAPTKIEQPKQRIQPPAASSTISPRAAEAIPREPYVEPLPAVRPLLKQPLAIAALGIALVVGTTLVIHFMNPGTKPTGFDDLEWTAAQQLLQQSPNRLREVLSRYQAVIEKHGAHEQSANQQIQQILRDQQQAKDDMKLGDDAQSKQQWEEAENHYRDAGAIDYGLESKASGEIAKIEGLKKGKSLDEIALEIDKEAENRFANKQWDEAKPLFLRLRDMVGANPALRSTAAERLTVVNAHIEEEDLFRRAIEEKKADRLDEAKTLFQEVANRKGDHLAEALQQLNDISLLVGKENKRGVLREQIEGAIAGRDFAGARNKYSEYLASGPDANNQLRNEIDNGEDRWFGDLKSKFESAKNDKDVNNLEAMKGEFLKIGEGSGKDAGEARDIATNEIPKALTEIKKSLEEASWNQAVADFGDAVKTKDANALQGKITSEFQQIVGGHGGRAADALTYVNTEIPNAIKSITTTKQPQQTEATRILHLLDEYAQAYAHRDRTELIEVWPTMTEKQFNEYGGNFKNLDTIRLTVDHCGAPEINGNSASIACTQTAVITVRGQSPQTLLNASTFYLRKSENNVAGWTIDHIEIKKMVR